MTDAPLAAFVALIVGVTLGALWYQPHAQRIEGRIGCDRAGEVWWVGDIRAVCRLEADGRGWLEVRE